MAISQLGQIIKWLYYIIIILISEFSLKIEIGSAWFKFYLFFNMIFLVTVPTFYKYLTKNYFINCISVIS